MNISDEYFWKASVEELKTGYVYNKESGSYICLICGKIFEDGVIYPLDDGRLYSAQKAVEVHIRDSHVAIFEYYLEMGKVYNGLTDHQKNLMRMFYEGLSDKEIVEKTDATNTSTIRNQRFAFKEKYKQAKIVVAMMELLEERRGQVKMNVLKPETANNEDLIDIHRTATMIDERYAITQSEKDDVIERYFNKDNMLVIKEFPAKEKKKIIILQHLMKEFEANKIYTEKEVNMIIKNFYDDIPTVRRYLVQYGFLDRKVDGSAYWIKQ